MVKTKYTVKWENGGEIVQSNIWAGTDQEALQEINYIPRASIKGLYAVNSRSVPLIFEDPADPEIEAFKLFEIQNGIY